MGTDSLRVASRETTIFPAFFFNPKTALSEAPEAGMIFSQYTVFVKTFYQTTYSGKSTEVIL